MMLLFSWQLSVSAKRTAQFALHCTRTTAVFQQLERKESEIHGKYQNQDVYLSRQTLRRKETRKIELKNLWRPHVISSSSSNSDLNTTTLMRKMNEIVQSHDIFSNLLPNRIHAKLVNLMVKAGLKKY